MWDTWKRGEGKKKDSEACLAAFAFSFRLSPKSDHLVPGLVTWVVLAGGAWGGGGEVVQ